jgi:hypothetical protein
MKHLPTLLLLASTGLGSAYGAGPIEIRVRVTVPDGGWVVAVEEVCRVGDALWVVSRLSRKPGMAVQMISTVEDRVTVSAPDLPVRHFVLGKTWKWANKEPYEFLKTRTAIARQLREGRVLFRKETSNKKRLTNVSPAGKE